MLCFIYRKRKMFLKSLARVAGVGGAVSAATLIKNRHKDPEPSWTPHQLPINAERWENLQIKAQLLSNDMEANKTNTSNVPSDHEHQDEQEEEAVLDELAETVTKPNEMSKQQAQAEKLKAAITKARNLVWCKMYESGAPGMVVCVSVNGKTVWQHGFGYSDLENHLLTGTGCVMRIASISKSITMAVLAKLWEEGKIDIDKNVTEYVPDFPKKVLDGKEVNITVRQLCCHMSGIRHYNRKGEKDEDEFCLKEYYIKDTFKTTDDSVALFKDDELLSAPGTEFNYTTHGFTLLAKVIENVVGEFITFMYLQPLIQSFSRGAI